jgi:hypothetical protein
VAGSAIVLALAAGAGYQPSRPEPRQSAVALATWLEAHGLHSGVGDYRSASITTI